MAFLPVLLILSACVNIVRIENGISPVSVFQTSLNRSSIELVNKTTPEYFSNISKSRSDTKAKGFLADFGFSAIFSSIEIKYNAYIIHSFNSFNLNKKSVFPSQYLIAFIHKKSISHKSSFEDPFANS